MGRESLFEFAGGEAAFRRLAAAHHERCVADEVLNHPFSHGVHPDHVEHLADYWGEVFGGPARFSESYGGQSAMLHIHAESGADDELGERFVACFVLAMEDAEFPSDPEFRACLRAYMEWAVRDVHVYSPHGSTVPEGLSLPHWSWDGLQLTSTP